MPNERGSSKHPPGARQAAAAGSEPTGRQGIVVLLPWIPALVVLAGAGVWLLVRAHWYSTWTDDDAFISFRYARNLATGNGLVYNVGERTEGYTNFLWTLLMAVMYRVDTDLPRVARWLGSLIALVTPALLFLGTTHLGALRPPASLPAAARVLVAALAPLLLASSDAWAAWSVGGLECVLSAFLVTAAYLTYLRTLDAPLPPEAAASAALEATRGGAAAGAEVVDVAMPTWASQARPMGAARQLLVTALLLVLAVLNHPSNLLLAFPIAVHVLWRIRSGELERRALWGPMGLFLVLLGVWEVWRLTYYHDWLPNTYHAKVGFTSFVLWRGLRFLRVALEALPLAAVALVGLTVFLTGTRQARHPGWLLVAAVVLHTFYVLGIGGEEFPALRVFVVVLPLLALVMQMLANQLCHVSRARAVKARAALAVLVVAGFTAAHATFLYASPRLRVLDQPVRLQRTALSRAAALRLKASLPAETLFAHSGAGLLAYYTNFRWIDTLGLTDRTIARRKLDSMGKGAAGHEKGDGAYVWSRKPDYVMFPGYPISDARPSTRGDLELFAIPEFQTTYRSVRFPFEFQGPTDDVPRQHFLFLWERIVPPSGR